MTKIFGKVVSLDLYDAPENSGCLTTCYESEDCILAYFDTTDRCLLFNFNETQKLEVEETTKADGFFVAFKTTYQNDTCPPYDLLSLEVNIGEDPITWKKLGNTYSFQKCVGDWKMFHRTGPEVTVCMQPMLPPALLNITQSKEYCENMGYKLTGVATVEESKWILDKMKVVKPNWNYWQAFYIDGVRTQNCSDSNPQCNDFDWSDGYTVIDDAVLNSTNAMLTFHDDNYIPENCLGVVDMGTSLTINDINCETFALNVGLVCGYKLY
ncbi:hypothetical protein GCK72_021324 [Caenorhabditis remanei]|uniref:PAN-3 domain-containing protein n=1 Tax=Caenorhabditis remanei TaxID=31234 RepID=A0A6A5GHU5_CAERE|nr:hypothetical protein GCK72_021324 [Caenorhabditis remanei]KAF1754760.1 hypothetical protein GCK72_021324 [Caenorhabditis remanei]